MADRVVQNGVAIREMGPRSGTDSTGEDDSATRMFKCSGNTDPLFCRTQLLTADLSPLGIDVWTYDGLNLRTLSYKPLGGPEDWAFEGGYAIAPLTGGYTVSIDTGGGLVKRTSAFAQTSFPAAGVTPPDYGVSVDVQDGKVQGVDTIIPALKIDVTAKLDKGLLTDPMAYSKTVAAVTGQTNNGPFLGFAQGELLFAGGTGDVIVERDPTITFTFLASENVTGLQVGPISNITKAGHDYIWFKYKSSKNANVEVQEAAVAYVSRVYGEADLSVLGIGEIATMAQRLEHEAYLDEVHNTNRERQVARLQAEAEAQATFAAMRAAG